MPRAKGTKIFLNASKMAKRINARKDNIYDEKVIKNILDMYMEECQKAISAGESVHITKVGTIIPELKVCMAYNMPNCNKEGGNPPHTKLRIYRSIKTRDDMNRILIQNVENGIYGLKKLPFSEQQLAILKDSGYIPEDAEIDHEKEGE
ncbi:MAG: hypothetical protein NC341_01145 [Blautia sp.]|nr:hypothetical protein [Blautia sp.]